MPHVLTAIDGRNHTISDERDILAIIQDYTGSDIRQWMEDWMQMQHEEILDAKAEVKDLEKDLDKLRDHQRLVMSDIYEDTSWILQLTSENRLKRADIRECAQRIHDVIYEEL